MKTNKTCKSKANPALLIAAGVLGLSLILGACSSKPSGNSSTTTTQAGSTTTSTPGTTTAHVPQVTNATNLAVEPVVQGTTGPPPKSVLISDLVVGTGKAVTVADTLSVNYVGASFATGAAFTQSTWTTKKPGTLSMTGIIPGLENGLVGMKVGGRREVVIPSKYGYGATGSPPTIQPNESLVFVVDLISLKPTTK